MDVGDRFLQFALLDSDWVLWVLIGLSILSVTVAVERVLRLRRAASSQRGLRRQAMAAWSSAQRGDASEHLLQLRRLADRGTGPTAALLQGTFEASRTNAEVTQPIHEAYRNAQRLELERNLDILGTVGANAPFIGLFGTVLEILRVFHDIGVAGMMSSDSALGIMSGISEALVATAVGLLVAIPAVITYNALLRWSESLLGTAEEICRLAQASLHAVEA